MDLFNLSAILRLDSSQYEEGLKNAKEKASSFGSVVKNGIGAALKVGAAAFATASAAVGTFAVTSIKSGESFDKAMSQVGATMLKTTEELEKEIGSVNTAYGEFSGNLREFAQFLGAKTAFSATQAAEALNYMALAGYNTQESMNMLPNVLSLAAAGSFDLARASDMITDTQTAFGISAERTTLLVDEMAKAASSGNTSVEQLGDAFLVIGGLAQELNGGFVETANGANLFADGTQELEIALTAMANAGVKGSEAGTHMRNMLMKLSNPTSEGTKLLEEMGIAVFDDEERMRSLSSIFGDLNKELSTMTQQQKIQAISTLFNARDLASAEALLNAVGQDWNEIGEAILNSKISLNEVSDAVRKSEVDLAKYGIESLQDIEKFAGDIRMNLTTEGMTAEEAAANIADAYDISMEDAKQAVEAVNEAILNASGSAAAMAEIQLDNLAGDITKFKSALEGAQILISNVLTPSLREFVQFGTKAISDMSDAFKERGFSGAMEVFSGIVTEGLNRIIEAFPEFVSAGSQLLFAVGSGIIEALPTILDSGMEIVNWVVDGIKANFPNIFATALDMLLVLGSGITEALPVIFSVGLEIIGSITESIRANLPSFVPAALDMLLSLTANLRENVGMLVDAALAMIMTLANGLIDNLPVLIQKVPTIVSNIAGVINDNAPKLLMSGLTLIKNLLLGIINAVPTLIAEFPKIIKSIVDVFTAFNWLSIGKNIISGIVSGIKNAAGSVVSAIKDVASSAFNGVLSFLGIRSPSRLFREKVGKMIPAGLALGIEDASPLVTAAVEDMNEDAFDTIDDIGYDTDMVVRRVGTDDDERSGGKVAELLQKLIDAIEYMDEGLYEKMAAAFGDISLEVNEREFGRLVNGVRTS